MKSLIRFTRSHLCLGLALAAPLTSGQELVHIDGNGVIRWSSDQTEVALFGANYSLPSASDYRAAGYAGADRKRLIEQDLTHFARMGWDGLRLAIWGDWENCDREGNLIVNDHLDLFDYVIAQAKKRNISMLLTPIHRHSSRWPENTDEEAQGFARHFPVEELGTNPAAIAAQQNYLRQLLEHVNPYTGTAIKDEPSILFVELINEPHHHPEDAAGSVRYINALAEAVRSTGCNKLLFHNLTQDNRMAPLIGASKAQGFTFAWYPTGLVARRTLTENYLRWVDDFEPLHRPEIPAMPRIVYEFDSADMTAAYIYPAMVREFRAAGAQFAAMFGYDMLATAPKNTGWQTHYLNLVYSPRKAMSAVIASQAMRDLPRGVHYGLYPLNRRFGPVRVDYESDLSEYISATMYLNAGDTLSPPPSASTLTRVAGVGRSPLVGYDGTGCYFLDRIAAGVWRLEVYPDAYFVNDPFSLRYDSPKLAARAVWRTWPMEIRLADLGDNFAVVPLNPGNTHQPPVSGNTVEIRPGVYLLTRSGAEVDLDQLPQNFGALALDEFVCPPPDHGAPQWLIDAPQTHTPGEPLQLRCTVVGETLPRAISLALHDHEGRAVVAGVPLRRGRGATWFLSALDSALPPADLRLSLSAEFDDGRTIDLSRTASENLIRFASKDSALRLFDAAADARRISLMRNPGPRGSDYLRVDAQPADGPALIQLTAPSLSASFARIHAAGIGIKQSIQQRSQSTLEGLRSLRLHLRGSAASVDVFLIEADGTPWTATVSLNQDWQTIELPLSDFVPGVAVKLPLGYPGSWNDALRPAAGRGQPGDHLRVSHLEHLQFRLPASASAEEPHVNIAYVELIR